MDAYAKARKGLGMKVKPGKKKYWVSFTIWEYIMMVILLIVRVPLDEVVDEFSRFYIVCI